jgi:CBS domain-containing protein
VNTLKKGEKDRSERESRRIAYAAVATPLSAAARLDYHDKEASPDGRLAMQVKEILRVKGNRLITAEPGGRAVDAVKTMAEQNLGSLVVLDQGRMSGMLTFHELLAALAKRSGALGDVKVSEIMVRDPVTTSPEMEVNDLRRTMLDTGARYLPVLQDGKLLGVISFRDVAKAVLEEQDFENKMLKGYIKNWPA